MTFRRPVTTTGLNLVIKPFPIPLGAASPATGSGELTADRYSLHLTGGAELGRLLNLAQAFGVGTPGVGLGRSAQVDLEVAGAWMGFAEPSPSGKLQVSTATAELQGVSEPLLIDTAVVTLENQLIEYHRLLRRLQQRRTVQPDRPAFPVHCTGPENCVLQFDVRTAGRLPWPVSISC